MSLINQMLKDLENRHQSKGGKSGVFDGVRSSTLGEQDEQSWQRYRLPAVLFLVFVAVVWFMVPIGAEPQAAYHQKVTTFLKWAQSPKQLRDAQQLVQEARHGKLKIVPKSTAAFQESEGVQGKVSALTPEQITTAKPAPAVAAVPERVHWHLTKAEVGDLFPAPMVATSAPQQARGPGMQAPLAEASDAMAINPRDIQSTRHSTPAELPVHLVTKGAKPDKHPIKLVSPHQQQLNLARHNYHLALAQLKQHKQPAAEQLLHKALKQVPDFNTARQALVSMLIKQGRQHEAGQMLATGLTLAADYPPFIQLQAQLLIQQGNLAAAKHLLLSYTPSLKSHLGYYALLAGLYQRTGSYGEAESLYEQLLSVVPEQSIWWMGLGLASENLDKQEQAEKAFHQAIVTGHLTPALLAFVRGRL